MSEYLFSYGTLQKHDVQLELFGRLLVGAQDVLKGYTLLAIEIKDEVFLSRGEQAYQLTALASENAEENIEGTIFEVSENELRTADRYEPDGYARTKVKLESGKEAWIYIATDKR